MKKCLLFAILAVCALGLRAEFNRLVFYTLDGEEQSVGLTGLNITFVNGELVATSEEASATVPLASLASMEFANGEIDGIKAASTAELAVTVYSADGICQGAFASKDAARETLPSGLYIIKSHNGLTSKMLINK